jgi:hypothetical protein
MNSSRFPLIHMPSWCVLGPYKMAEHFWRPTHPHLEELFAIRETRATCESMTFTGTSACQFWEWKSESNAYVKSAETIVF